MPPGVRHEETNLEIGDVIFGVFSVGLYFGIHGMKFIMSWSCIYRAIGMAKYSSMTNTQPGVGFQSMKFLKT
jgi:hypothetical protein